MVADPWSIANVGYKTYHSMVDRYRVVAFGWPMAADGSLKDPSDMGGLAKLKEQVGLLRAKKAGFRRITEGEWKVLKEARDAQVEAGELVLPQRKTRSDAGQKKRPSSINTDAHSSSKKVRNIEIRLSM